MSDSFKLEDLDLDEVSAVDDPANPLSLMALFKRHKPKHGENPMNIEELTKRLEDTEGLVQDLEKERDDAVEKAATSESEVDAIKKALEAEGVSIVEVDGQFTVEKAEEPEYIEVDGEKVEKSLLPTPVLKRLEAQQAQIDALVKRGEMAELAKRAEAAFPHLAGKPEEKAHLVKMLDDLEGPAQSALEKALKAADAAVSKMFDEVGDADHEDLSDAQKKLDALVAKYAEEKSVASETAFAEVTKSGEGRSLLLETRNSAN